MAHGKNEPKLGELITDDTGRRDAVHVAIAPVTAGQTLQPGQHVGVLSNWAVGKSNFPVGIVDPYLKDTVKKGQRFWLFLYPNTVTSLRHQWTHPDFPDEDPDKDVKDTLKKIAEFGNEESIRWLSKYAAECEMGYQELIELAKGYLSSGDTKTLPFSTPSIVYSSPETFWEHFEKVTGVRVPKTARGDTFIGCAC